MTCRNERETEEEEAVINSFLALKMTQFGQRKKKRKATIGYFSVQGKMCYVLSLLSSVPFLISRSLSLPSFLAYSEKRKERELRK